MRQVFQFTNNIFYVIFNCMNLHIITKRASNRKVTKLSNISITEGSIWKGILVFFFPILFGTFFQQLYNTFDAIVVGRYVGKEALAAVGGGVAVYVNLLVGFFVGLSSGASVTISQFYGAKKPLDTSNAVHTAITMAFAGGAILTGVGFATANLAMKMLGTPHEILVHSTTYLRIFFIGMIPLFIYNMGSSILRAIGDSVTPLILLIVSCFTNIILDYTFVVGLKWGIKGVAWATVIAETESMLLVIITLARTKDCYKFSIKKLGFTAHILRDMLKIGFPAGVQSSMYTVSNLLIQAAINSFGTNSIAAWAAYGKIDIIFWMIVNAFGISVTTFAGQNYGAGKYDRMKKGMWITLLMTSFTTIFISVLLCLTGTPIFKIFTDDESVVTEGMSMLRFLAPTYITYISIEILSGTIRGAGDSFVPMLISCFGICILRVIWISFAVPKWHIFNVVSLSYPITWTTTSVLYWIYYISGKWLRKQK